MFIFMYLTNKTLLSIHLAYREIEIKAIKNNNLATITLTVSRLFFDLTHQG